MQMLGRGSYSIFKRAVEMKTMPSRRTLLTDSMNTVWIDILKHVKKYPATYGI